jgi:carboxylesterase
MDFARPFWLKTEKSSAIVICLHGFGATTYESRPIGDALYQNGIDAAGFLFPAHGYKDNAMAKKAMANVKYSDWLQATREEIAQARKYYKQVFIYGQSMGGIIALIMAREGLVDAVAVTAPALKLPKGVGLGMHLLGWLNVNTKITANPPFFNECYDFTNLRSVKQLYLLAMEGRKNLEKITCRVFHAHSHNDDIIDPIVATWLYKSIGKNYRVEWYDQSGHTMPLDKETEHIKKDISQYFRNIIDRVPGL